MDRLRTMQSFVRVARAGSYLTAARQLGVSAALVSRHISDLEARLGVRLINRSTRTFRLTEAGESYANHCERILHDIEQGEHAVANENANPVGTLRVVAPNSFGIVCLKDAIFDFVREQPQLQVGLTLDDYSPLTYSLSTYDFVEKGYDVAVRTSPLRDSRLITRRLATLEWVLCASPDYLQREGRPKTIEDLKSRPCLGHLLFDANAKAWRFSTAKGTVSVKIDGPVHSNNTIVLRDAALNGLGIALLPRAYVASEIASKRLTHIVLPQVRGPRRQMSAVYPKATQVPRKVRLFVDFLVKWYGKREAFSGG
jgi:DNA-binding transcriptional LysR family regulator